MTSTTLDRMTSTTVELFDADLAPITGRLFGYKGMCTEAEARRFTHLDYVCIAAAATAGAYETTLNPNLGDLAHRRREVLEHLAYIEITTIVHEADYSEADRITKLFFLRPARPASPGYLATFRLVEE